MPGIGAEHGFHCEFSCSAQLRRKFSHEVATVVGVRDQAPAINLCRCARSSSHPSSLEHRAANRMHIGRRRDRLNILLM